MVMPSLWDIVDGLVGLDRRLFLWIHQLQKVEGLSCVLGWPTFFGQLEILLALVFFAMARSRRKGWLKQYLAFGVIVGLAHLSATLLKLAFARPRPFDFFSPDVMIQVLFDRPGTYSFPSGHAAAAFAAAGLIHFLYGRKAWLVYILALMVALSRIFVGVHYPSDVAAGALLGLFVSWLGSRFLSHWDPQAFPARTD